MLQVQAVDDDDGDDALREASQASFGFEPPISLFNRLSRKRPSSFLTEEPPSPVVSHTATLNLHQIAASKPSPPKECQRAWGRLVSKFDGKEFKLSSSSEANEPQLCDHCEESLADRGCAECGIMYCQEDWNVVHRGKLKGHSFALASESCRKHPGWRIDTVCLEESCSAELICCQCKLSPAHALHSSRLLELHADEQRVELQAAFLFLQSKVVEEERSITLSTQFLQAANPALQAARSLLQTTSHRDFIAHSAKLVSGLKQGPHLIAPPPPPEDSLSLSSAPMPGTLPKEELDLSDFDPEQLSIAAVRHANI